MDDHAVVRAGYRRLIMKPSWRPVPRWEIGLGMTARSKAFVRGNENNGHRPGGTDEQEGIFEGDPLGQRPTPPGRPFTTAGSVPGHAVSTSTPASS